MSYIKKFIHVCVFDVFPQQINSSVFRRSVERSLLPSAVFLIFAECRPQLKTQRSLLQAVCHWNVARKARKKRKKTAPVSWRPCAGRYSRERAYNFWLIMPVSDLGQLAALPLTSKRKPRHCGESTGKSDHNSVTKYHQFRAVAIVVDRILQLLISRECFWGEAEREWWEAEVTSALRCVLLERKRPTARSPQMKKWTKQQFLASAVQVMVLSGIVLFDKGSRISREFHCFA